MKSHTFAAKLLEQPDLEIMILDYNEPVPAGFSLIRIEDAIDDSVDMQPFLMAGYVVRQQEH